MEEKMGAGNGMIVKLADNIISPLGAGTEANFEALRHGKSCLRLHSRRFGVHEPFMASLFDEGFWDSCLPPDDGAEELSRFERLCIASAADALGRCYIDAASPRTLFVLSTTKGNVEFLDSKPEKVGIGASARTIARHFGNNEQPVVTSNACISGVCAQIAAKRWLESGRYDNIVVIGCDVQSKFIVSGFQSFKALSPEPCKPFDKDRRGLNLGEAAATMILGRSDTAASGQWVLEDGATRNDANHISGPSRTGEGAYKCLRYVTEGRDTGDIAFINAHGTATAYNDEMESIAIDRAGLAGIPVNTYKGYYGHTMGAAGVMETIISQAAVDHNIIIGTRGYANMGVSRPLDVSAETRPATGRGFIKLISGFGGCNAAVLWKKGGTGC